MTTTDQPTTATIPRRRAGTQFHRAVAMLAVATALGGCGSDGGTDAAAPAGSTLRIQAGAAPISGATCTLTDSAGRALASSVTTSAAGSASFNGVGTGTGLVLVSCSGGSYTDLASGGTRTSARLRSYVANPSAAGSSGATAMVTPLTELSVRLLGTQSADTGYATVRGWVARGFGLEGIDIGSVAATDLSTTAAADSDASRHGLALAALSQLELKATSGATADTLITAFAANIDSHGYPKDMALPMAYAHALEAVLANTRLRAQLAGVGSTVARAMFDRAVHDEPLASIDYVDADDSPTDSGQALHVVAPGVPSTLAVGGRWLHLGLDVRLGAAACRVHDLLSDEHEESTGDQELLATCPALPAGTAALVISDAGVVVSQTAFTVQAVAAPSANTGAGRARALSAQPRMPDSGTGPVTLTGTVTALAPTVNVTTGGHDYGTPRSFTVKGVVVELLDRAAGDAVLLQTATDGDGKYTFNGVDAGRNVVVRVKAQLLKTRPAGVTTGAQWNLAVRDNTSTGAVAGGPKALYVLDSAPLTTTAGTQTQDLLAPLGFAADGTAGADDTRKSAPFSILEVAYSAMTKIEATDANVVFPDVNFYWSPKNVGASGDKESGDIGTSHYAAGGTLPGVFILGKADVDTDEFDQGVIGHEFGHWLQAVLSASDNPGGNHAKAEFKDASLAYGEGYGTAVGGLLSGSPYYIDTAGVKQASGGVTNLDLPTADGARKGFYAEESVQYVMYQIGKRHGFTAFWSAVSAMKADHYSATVFAFLHRFITAHPALAVTDLLAGENIRSTDPLGTLPAGAVADTAIAASQNKGTSVSGADDLETLYLPLAPANVSAGSVAVAMTPNAPQFCINHNMKGAQLSNGLGMLRRFTFTAPFSGDVGIKFADDKGAPLDKKDWSVLVRTNVTGKVPTYAWSEGSQIVVQQGATYTVRFQQHQANVFQGSRCGNALSLWRLPA